MQNRFINSVSGGLPVLLVNEKDKGTIVAYACSDATCCSKTSTILLGPGGKFYVVWSDSLQGIINTQSQSVWRNNIRGGRTQDGRPFFIYTVPFSAYVIYCHNNLCTNGTRSSLTGNGDDGLDIVQQPNGLPLISSGGGPLRVVFFFCVKSIDMTALLLQQSKLLYLYYCIISYYNCILHKDETWF